MMSQSASYSRLENHDDESMKPRPEGKWNYTQILWRVLIDACVVILVVVLIHTVVLPVFDSPQPIGYHRLPAKLRHAPQEVVRFEANWKFDWASNGSEAAWKALIPKGRGYVLVDHSSRGKLKPGISATETADGYALSAFHQVHCLAMLQTALYTFRDASSQGHGASPKSKGHASHKFEMDHIDHCIDYLRQAIMCAADPAVESAVVSEDGSRVTVDGWGSEHQCRSWDELVAFALRERYRDDQEIFI